MSHNPSSTGIAMGYMIPQPRILDELAEKVVEAIALAKATARTSCVRAAELGGLLEKAKRLLGYREYGQFLKKIGIEERMAQHYRTLWRAFQDEETRNAVSGLSLRRALKVLAGRCRRR